LGRKQEKPMTFASDICSYTLQFSGTLDDDFLASFCPAGTTLTFHADITTLANLRTDQSGIIGIIRRLHNLGCILLALETEQESYDH
jgi:hypothetical protein